jgi:hypothetical protein
VPRLCRQAGIAPHQRSIGIAGEAGDIRREARRERFARRRFAGIRPFRRARLRRQLALARGSGDGYCAKAA